jgi:hypothetical protein
MLPVGPILLTILILLIYFGLLDHILADMRLSPRAALLYAVAMLLGSLVTFEWSTWLSVSIGSAVLPVGAVVFLIATTAEPKESARTVLAALAAGACVFAIGQWFEPGRPTELNLFGLDAQYLYGLSAGGTAFLVGRSKRSAFCAGVLGVVLADLAHVSLHLVQGVPPDVRIAIGGGGLLGTAAAAGILALFLADWLGVYDESGRTPAPHVRNPR